MTYTTDDVAPKYVDGKAVEVPDYEKRAIVDRWNSKESVSIEEERGAMVITQYQARAALNNAGLLSDVEALMADPTTDADIKLQWNHKPRIRRLHPATTSMASALGWSDTQLDDLFRAAMKLEE